MSIVNSKNYIIGIAAAAAIAACSVYMFSPRKDDDLAPAISEEEAKSMMNEVLEKLKIHAAKMIRAAESIKQQLRQQGQDVDDRTLMKTFIFPHFETAFKDVQSQVLEDHDFEEYELEEAVNSYIAAGDSSLQQISNKIREIYKQFGGDVDDDDDDEEQDGDESSSRPERELTLQELLAMLKHLGEIVNSQTEEYVKDFLSTKGSPTQSTSSMEAFQLGMMKLSEEAEQTMLANFGVSVTEFQKSMMMNQDSQLLQGMIINMQLQNQQKLQSCGIILE